MGFWVVVPRRRVVHLRGVSAEAVELAVEASDGAPAMITHTVTALDGVPDTVSNLLAELDRAARGLITQWLPRVRDLAGPVALSSQDGPTLPWSSKGRVVADDPSYKDAAELAEILAESELADGGLLGTLSRAAQILLNEGAIDQEQQRVDLAMALATRRSPEEIGMVLATAAISVRERDADEALELYARALETFLSVDSPMGRAFAVDVLHSKAAFLRLIGQDRESLETIRLGTRLVQAWDFGVYRGSRAEFLEEVAHADRQAYLELTGKLLSSAQPLNEVERFPLVNARVTALMAAGRFAEAADRAGREIARGTYSTHRRQVLTIHMAECEFHLSHHDRAAALCEQLMNQASADVVAHAALIRGRCWTKLDRHEEALRDFLAGWEASRATTWGGNCAVLACVLLNELGRHEECLSLVAEMRRDAVFPENAAACLIGAVAAARLERHDLLRDLLVVGAWAQVDPDYIVTAHRLDFVRDLESSLESVARAAYHWIVDGDSSGVAAEVRKGRDDFARYWIGRAIDRCLSIATTARENLDRLVGDLAEQARRETSDELGAIMRTLRELVDDSPRLALELYRTFCERLDRSWVLDQPRIRLLYADAAFYVARSTVSSVALARRSPGARSPPMLPQASPNMQIVTCGPRRTPRRGARLSSWGTLTSTCSDSPRPSTSTREACWPSSASPPPSREQDWPRPFLVSSGSPARQHPFSCRRSIWATALAQVAAIYIQPPARRRCWGQLSCRILMDMPEPGEGSLSWVGW